jgi:hypothetical protein
VSDSLHVVAVVAAVVVAGLAVYQVLLSVGLPVGRAAFGGAHRILPLTLRAASGVAAIIFLVAFYVVLARGGVIGPTHRSSFVRDGTWILVVIFGASAVTNTLSKSPWERFLMAPLGLVLTACCLTLAVS